MSEKIEQLALFGGATPAEVRSEAAAGSSGTEVPLTGPCDPPTSPDDSPSIPVPGQEDFFGNKATVTEATAALGARARDCRRCGLREGCRGVVFGEGDPESGILLLGEGPGGTEDELGRPFVGSAGQLLDKILLAVGFRREQVYITNTVLCRPPGNRVPLPEEVAACRLWLDERLVVMRPAIIVCLGASAGQNLLGPDFRITRDRGRWYSYGSARLLATFHPAALLRDPSKKRPVWEDMKVVRAEWLRLQSGVGPSPEEGRSIQPGN